MPSSRGYLSAFQSKWIVAAFVALTLCIPSAHAQLLTDQIHVNSPKSDASKPMPNHFQASAADAGARGISPSFRTQPENPKEKPRDLTAPIAGNEKRGFYASNSASTIFQNKAKIKEKPPIEFFNARLVIPEDETPAAAPGSTEKEPTKAELQSPEGILKAFGSPTEDDKILALEHAPDSFKGMMAALQIGDQELAWQYARRYARRMRELKDRNMTTVGLIGKAMVREGMLAPDSWAGSPQYSEQQKLLDQDLKSGGLVNEEATRIAALDPKAREFLEKAQAAEEQNANPKVENAGAATQEQPLTEEQQRAQIRQSLTGKIPVDPKGEVLVFFFFRPYDRGSLEMVPDVESLYRAIATEGGVTFLASGLESMTPQEVTAFRTQSNTTFPIKNAQRAAKEFGISQAPTVAFISPNTGKAVFEQGKRSFVYLDEVSRMMRGK